MPDICRRAWSSAPTTSSLYPGRRRWPPSIETGARITAITRQRHGQGRQQGPRRTPVRADRSDGDGCPLRPRTGGHRCVGNVEPAQSAWAPGASRPMARTELAQFIDYGLPDVLGRRRSDYAGKTTLVVGAGYSAADVLLDLAKLKQDDPYHDDPVGDPQQRPDARLWRRARRISCLPAANLAKACVISSKTVP